MVGIVAPSPTSFTPHGPAGSKLSTSAEVIRGISVAVGILYTPYRLCLKKGVPLMSLPILYSQGNAKKIIKFMFIIENEQETDS
jgi:hypothetical protein